MRLESPCFKSTKSEASAVDAGSLFQRGIDLGKKLYLKQSRVVEIFLYFFEWLAFVFAVAGVRYKSLSMSTMLDDVCLLVRLIFWPVYNL